MRGVVAAAGALAGVLLTVAASRAEETGAGSKRDTTRRAPVPPAVQRAMQYVETGELPEDDRSGTRDQLDAWDPYGLLEETGRLVDASTPRLDVEAMWRYRTRSAFERVGAMGRALATAEALVEGNDRNVSGGRKTLYVLGRSARDPGYLGNLSDRQLVLVRAAVRSDARSQTALRDMLEPVRAEFAMALEHEKEVAVEQRRPVDFPGLRVTVADGAASQRVVEVLLEEKAPRPEVAAIIEELERLSAEWDRRVMWSETAPLAPMMEPELKPIVSADTPLPRETFGDPRRPDSESVEAPEASGLQLSADVGTKVRSAAAGTVAYTGEVRGMGPVVIVEHEESRFTVYARLGSISVSEGAKLAKGDSLGTVGPVPWGQGFGAYFEVRDGATAVETTRLLGDENAASAVLGR